MSKFKQVLAAAGIAVLGFVGYNIVQGDNTLAAETVECGDNSIIRCGAMTAGELKTKYAANDRDTQAIFTHYGITAADIENSQNAKTGYVNPDGTVVVDGKVVATGAYSVGRNVQSGGTAVKITDNTTVYEGQGRVHSTLSAYVFFNADGSFKAAIIKVCGNPVKATAVPVPVYKCDTLKADKISRNEYKFTTTATAKNGATIKGYTYAFGDGSTENGNNVITHTYAKAGTYTASVTVKVEVDGKLVNAPGDCKVTVPVEPEMVKACEIKTGVITNVDKEKIDNVTYTNDLSKCDKAKYCDTVTKTFVTVIPSQKKDTYTTDYEKCKVTVCDTTTKTIVTIDNDVFKKDTSGRYTEDQSKCAEPVVELPRTGVAEYLGGGLGAGALSLAGYYYFASRRLL